MNSKQIELTLHEIHLLSFNNKDINIIMQLLYSMHIYKYLIKKIYITNYNLESNCKLKHNKYLIYNESEIFNSILIILNNSYNNIITKYYITKLNNIYLLGITYNLTNYNYLNNPLEIKFYLLSDVINIICINFINIEIFNIHYIIDLIIENNKIIEKDLKNLKNKKKNICNKCIIM
jgi:hypothetical protein